MLTLSFIGKFTENKIGICVLVLVRVGTCIRRYYWNEHKQRNEDGEGGCSSGGGDWGSSMGSLTKCHVERQTKLLSFRWYEIVTTFRSQQIETNGIWMCYHYLACHESTTRKMSSRIAAFTFKNFGNKHKFIRNKKEKEKRSKGYYCMHYAMTANEELCEQMDVACVNKCGFFHSVEMRYTAFHNEVSLGKRKQCQWRRMS